jgi:hypothetical protein
MIKFKEPVITGLCAFVLLTFVVPYGFLVVFVILLFSSRAEAAD